MSNQKAADYTVLHLHMQFLDRFFTCRLEHALDTANLAHIGLVAIGCALSTDLMIARVRLYR